MTQLDNLCLIPCNAYTDPARVVFIRKPRLREVTLI